MLIEQELLTSKTASLAATAKMSAQETTPLHMFSKSDFMLSITSKPLRELAFGNEFFSPVKVSVSSNNTDASHPCNTKHRSMSIHFLNTNTLYCIEIMT